MKKTLSLLAILVASVGLSACNTMHGFGQDVEKGGEKIQSGASNTKNGTSASGNSSSENNR